MTNDLVKQSFQMEETSELLNVKFGGSSSVKISKDHLLQKLIDKNILVFLIS